jgi:RNA polymerase sigma-70 factor (ECF subfamily)
LSLSDADLIARACAGSQAACRELVLRYQRPVFNLIVRMIRDPAAAEELAQDAFLKALRSLATFDRAQKFSNWILRIAQNTTIDYLRVRRVETVSLAAGPDGEVVEWPLADPSAENPADAAERADLAGALERAIDRLRPDYRQLVVLRYQEDLSYEEIAGITGLPLGTIKSFLHRARAEMARDLADQGWGPAETAARRPATQGPQGT